MSTNEGLIAQQKAIIRDLKAAATEFKDDEAKKYIAKLLVSAKAQLDELRKKPPDQSALIEAVRKSLAVSLMPLLRDHRVQRPATWRQIPVNPPALLQLAAERVVRVFNAGQKERARRPRGKGDDGRVMRELVEDIAGKREHRDATAAELLNVVNDAAEENGMTPISIKRLRTVLREIRNTT